MIVLYYTYSTPLEQILLLQGTVIGIYDFGMVYSPHKLERSLLAFSFKSI